MVDIKCSYCIPSQGFRDRTLRHLLIKGSCYLNLEFQKSFSVYCIQCGADREKPAVRMELDRNPNPTGISLFWPKRSLTRWRIENSIQLKSHHFDQKKSEWVFFIEMPQSRTWEWAVLKMFNCKSRLCDTSLIRKVYPTLLKFCKIKKIIV